MHRFPVLLAAVTGQALAFMAAPASARCTTQQYIAYGREGLSDSQIREKCRSAIPGWLSGQWRVTLRMENFSIREPGQQKDTALNPFIQGMKSLTGIAERPEAEREELWLVGVQNGVLAINRVYHPKHDPGSAPFTAVLADRQQSGHRLTASVLDGNRLKTKMVSPPYGNRGIEEWSFDIGLDGSAGQKTQLSGRYRVIRQNPLDGKTYRHNGRIVLTRAR